MDKKTLLKRWVGGVLAVFFLAFGTTWKKQFCLGDVILGAIGLPAWSRGTQGLHYPAIAAIIAVPVCFYMIASTTRSTKNAMGNLILGTVLALYFISGLI